MDLKGLSQVGSKRKVQDATNKTVTLKKSEVLDKVIGSNHAKKTRIADSILTDESIKNIHKMNRSTRRAFLRTLADSDRRKILSSLKKIKDEEAKIYEELASAMDNWIIEADNNARDDLNELLSTGEFTPDEELAIQKVIDLEPMPAEDWVDVFAPLKEKFKSLNIRVPAYALLQDSVQKCEDEDEEDKEDKKVQDDKDLDKIIDGPEYDAAKEALETMVSALRVFQETGETEKLENINETVQDSLSKLKDALDDDGTFKLSQEALDDIYEQVNEALREKGLELPDSAVYKASKSYKILDYKKSRPSLVPLTYNEFRTVSDKADFTQVFNVAKQLYRSTMIPAREVEVVSDSVVRIKNGTLIQDWFVPSTKGIKSVGDFKSIADNAVLAKDLYKAAALLGKPNIMDSRLYKKSLIGDCYCSEPCLCGELVESPLLDECPNCKEICEENLDNEAIIEIAQSPLEGCQEIHPTLGNIRITIL